MAENDREAGLRRAATEPGCRPEFCRLLLESQVLVLGSSDRVPEGSNTLAAGSAVNIKNWGKADGSTTIPFFSSLDVLRQSIDSEENWLALPARALFEMTRGANLILNPRSDYNKEFFSAEVESLLADGVTHQPVRRVLEEETNILLG